jgi:hypothetical protein
MEGASAHKPADKRVHHRVPRRHRSPAGPKRAALERIVAEHSKALEGDIDHYFPRYDLRDLHRPRGGASGLTWRKLDVLIDRLPGESATKTAIRDSFTDEQIAELATQERAGHGPWSPDGFRLAAIEDAINRLTAITIFLAGERKGQPKMPEPVRRPGITGPRKRPKLTDEGRAYLKHLRENHGALPPGYKFVQAR